VRLFLAVILEGAEGGGAHASSTDLVQGLAFLAMMFNAAYVVRHLCSPSTSPHRRHLGPQDVFVQCSACMLVLSPRRLKCHTVSRGCITAGTTAQHAWHA
jgi:hypothetical protein